MRLIIQLLFFITLIPHMTYSQESLFKPLTANIYEPKVGMNFFNDGKLRLDIGNSIDLFEFSITDSIKPRIGGEFFIFTLLRKDANFKFPVETEDFYFGINSTSTIGYLSANRISARFRLAHISSHLIDGYTTGGKFKKPFYVYSREFIDLCFAIEIGNCRVYAGSTILYHSIPDDFSTIIPEIGFDYNFPLTRNIFLKAASDLRYASLNANILDSSNTSFSSNSELGMYFKFYKENGIYLYFNYYYGRSYFGEFFNEGRKNTAIGFRVMF
ncbi:MAG: DUF1207 domain-containing protein [Candidatus Kapabacteria bacterium]|nr:DUF1207 domain-containing protein [Candidatus Kapabacteria bacterium]